MPADPPSASPARLSWFNSAPPGELIAALRPVCAAPDWAGALVSGRPYPSPAALLAASDAATAALDATGIDQALAAHPPIGRPAPGDAASAREQRGMAGAPPALAAEVRELNDAYRRRFGQVFLICATGLTAGQLRDALRTRLGNSPDTERATVRTELAAIHRLRLTRLLAHPTDSTDPAASPDPAASAGPTHPPAAATTVSTHILDTAAGRPAPGIAVDLSVPGPGPGTWTAHATAVTDADGRCTGLPPLPAHTTAARLRFAVTGPFFPEISTTFAVTPGEHHHVPLLLSPFGYSVYRGS
ncbi:2-oxo-4-hydroxy-4-carboxy-5-ureidoimidazoline decarboxylase [Streptomyces harbinensis]|uniref:2-oxo-4-hydroxy-4-carboxy-5-ureidoimidazoline decarboxylase n=1 Tax=Streptomyces harbinensis TaxID=1176198 RepID=UPI0034DF4F5C